MNAVYRLRDYVHKGVQAAVLGGALLFGNSLEARAQEQVVQEKFHDTQEKERDISRYRKHDGVWWYEIEYNKWVYWDGDEWKKPKNIAPFPPKPPQGYVQSKHIDDKPIRDLTADELKAMEEHSGLMIARLNKEITEDEFKIKKAEIYQKYEVGFDARYFNDLMFEMQYPFAIEFFGAFGKSLFGSK